MTPRTPGSRVADAAAVGTLVLVALVTRLAFRYETGASDLNVVQMVSGLARGVSGAASFAETLVYGKNFSLGIYVGFWAAVRPLLHDPAQVMGVLNALGIVVSSIVLWPLYSIFRWTLSPLESFGALLVMAFTPVVWEMGTSFQPMAVAFLFVVLAAHTFRRIGSARAGVVAFVTTAVLGTASVLSRAEICLILPGLFALCLASEQRRRNTLRLVLVSTSALTVALLLIWTVGNQEGSEGQGLGVYLRRFADLYVRPAKIPHNIVWAALAVGLGSITAIPTLVTTALAGGKRSLDVGSGLRQDIFVSSAFTSPVFLFWMWHPAPVVRHYFLMVPPIAWLLGRTVLRGRPAQAVTTISALVLVSNLLAPELLYRGHEALVGGPGKAPHGTFFADHRARKQRIARFLRLRTELDRRLGPTESRTSTATRSGFLVQADREISTYVDLEIATRRWGLERVGNEVVEELVRVQTFEADGQVLRVVESSWSFVPEVRREIRAQIARGRERGDVIFVPVEDLPAGHLGGDSTWIGY